MVLLNSHSRRRKINEDLTTCLNTLYHHVEISQILRYFDFESENTRFDTIGQFFGEGTQTQWPILLYLNVNLGFRWPFKSYIRVKVRVGWFSVIFNKQQKLPLLESTRRLAFFAVKTDTGQYCHFRFSYSHLLLKLKQLHNISHIHGETHNVIKLVLAVKNDYSQLFFLIF